MITSFINSFYETLVLYAYYEIISYNIQKKEESETENRRKNDFVIGILLKFHPSSISYWTYGLVFSIW